MGYNSGRNTTAPTLAIGGDEVKFIVVRILNLGTYPVEIDKFICFTWKWRLTNALIN